MKRLVFALIVVFCSSFSFAQVQFCGMSAATAPMMAAVSTQRGGLYAPAKTLDGSSINLLVVFAQIASDTKDPSNPDWPLNQMPVWANTFIGSSPSQAPFAPGTLSNYFYEMSNGQNIVTGTVYPKLVKVFLPLSSYYYELNDSVLRKIDVDINFNDYDKWDLSAQYKQVYNKTDTFVDGIIIIWRNFDYDKNPFGGIALLGTNYETYEKKKVSDGAPTIGITVSCGVKGQYDWNSQLGLFTHEYGHYLISRGHNFEPDRIGASSGNRQRGFGLMPSSGGTIGMNPQEKYQLGYVNFTDLVSDVSGSLPDFMTSGTVLRIPVPLTIGGAPNNDPKEWFLIANHQKISQYDKARGTGVFIYHVKTPDYTTNQLDMVCADGLWQWNVKKWGQRPAGIGGPQDWQATHTAGVHPDTLPVLVHAYSDRKFGRDEMQETKQVLYGDKKMYWWDRWLDENGAFAKYPEGTQEDAFTIGYNEIFNIYSNPATYGTNKNINNNFGFRLLNQSGSMYNYQFCADTLSVLQQMPPSKPLEFKVAAVNKNTVLTWEAMLEPDVLNGGYIKVYRATTTGTTPPANSAYVLCASLSGASTTYMDDSRPVGSGRIRIYYKIKAVDNTNLESVFTDPGYVLWNGDYWKEKVENQNIEVYSNSLSKNYPDPFNPETRINYSLQKESRVLLQVFSLLGQRVTTLVDDVKPAGKYTVTFNAKDLSSGIYIYTLSTPDFSFSRKMLLMK